MKLKKWLEKWELTDLEFDPAMLKTEWRPRKKDREAAWELYVEMLTRVVTQALPIDHGDEKSALESIYALFAITREILRKGGRECVPFTRIAIVVLNQPVRPFTAKWHKLSLDGAFSDSKRRKDFRNELATLQIFLRKYARALADIAQVEDLGALAKDGIERTERRQA